MTQDSYPGCMNTRVDATLYPLLESVAGRVRRTCQFNRHRTNPRPLSSVGSSNCGRSWCSSTIFRSRARSQERVRLQANVAPVTRHGAAPATGPLADRQHFLAGVCSNRDAVSLRQLGADRGFGLRKESRSVLLHPAVLLGLLGGEGQTLSAQVGRRQPVDQHVQAGGQAAGLRTPCCWQHLCGLG